MWYKVKELIETGLNNSQIRRETGLDRGTIRKYRELSESEFHDWISQRKNLPKKLSDYYFFVKGQLESQPYLSAAQIEDRLHDHFQDLPAVHSKTIYNFVRTIRDEHGLAKTIEKAPRDYQKLPELPYGQEAQVDFGEASMQTETSYKIKVYFFAMVLSRSRQKYVYFQSHPFTTATAVYAHELAFEYFQGVPKKLLYDQDRVFIHDENLGDILMTEGFRSFTASHPFEPVFCRKSDPESKGKIENVIGYIKGNFLRGRRYKSVRLLQKESTEWLKRRGNGKVHGTTRKIPHQEWIKEQKHLQPIPYIPILPKCMLPEYRVRKDNCITYKGSYYSLPSGTYKGPGSLVLLEVKASSLCIYDPQHNKIVQHVISQEKGSLVRHESHSRSTSAKKAETYKAVLQLIDHEHAKTYLEQLEQNKPRYYHDNLKVMQKNLKGESKVIISKALWICLENKIYNAYEFGQVIRMCKKTEGMNTTSETPVIHNLNASYLPRDMDPETSNINYYESLLQ